MKTINDICVVVQARLGSQRVPHKMLKPFANTTLIEILFNKLKQSKIINISNIYFSAYEQELKDIAKKHKINIFHRSQESANEDNNNLLNKVWKNNLKLLNWDALEGSYEQVEIVPFDTPESYLTHSSPRVGHAYRKVKI